MPGVDLLPFFQGIYGEPVADEERFMCISFIQPGGKMIERFFRWPDEVDRALRVITGMVEQQTAHGRGADLYYCVSLTTGRKRNRDFLDQTHCIWADLDATPPNALALEPTFLIETSPSHYQAIWTLEEAIPFSTAEDFARRIYAAHRNQGADATWDATRLLRIPGTPNLKYQVNGVHPVVELVNYHPVGYTLDELDAAYPISVTTGPGTSQTALLDYAMVEHVGDINEILHRYARELNQDVIDLIYDVQDPNDERWSHRLWALEMSLFEAGMDIYEVFVVAREAECNKYARDGRPEADLWKEIVKAQSAMQIKVGMVLTTQEIEEIDLLTPEEIEQIADQPEGFIDRYRRWASNRTDAPSEFHVGGALMALSAALSDKIVIPTQFGEVKPNLWVMLVSDSTIARKTTSMRLALSISEGAGVDSLLATDGSIEGLITELGAREGQPSMFVRDEFTSLVDGAKRKDYMSGFMSDLCGLYDGNPIKRRLRKDTIKANRPVFLLFAGGVEGRLLEALGHEDITSGFIPRFLPIFGTTSVSELDLIGPRRKKNFAAKDNLIEELKTIIEMYRPVKPVLRVPNGDPGINLATPIEVELSEEAWTRLQEANRYLLHLADNHDSRDLLLPCTERLIVNVLKVAALIACSRQRPVVDGIVTMQYDDLLMSLYYARGWLDHLLRIVTRVGRDPFDARTYQVLEFITKQGEGGCTRSAVTRQYRMSARDADEIFDTLLDREEIVSDGGRGSTGRGAVFRATTYARTGKQVRVTAPLKVRRTNPSTRS